jgi:hypothetical protein
LGKFTTPQCFSDLNNRLPQPVTTANDRQLRNLDGQGGEVDGTFQERKIGAVTLADEGCPQQRIKSV